MNSNKQINEETFLHMLRVWIMLIYLLSGIWFLYLATTDATVFVFYSNIIIGYLIISLFTILPITKLCANLSDKRFINEVFNIANLCVIFLMYIYDETYRCQDFNLHRRLCIDQYSNPNTTLSVNKKTYKNTQLYGVE